MIKYIEHKTAYVYSQKLSAFKQNLHALIAIYTRLVAGGVQKELKTLRLMLFIFNNNNKKSQQLK